MKEGSRHNNLKMVWVFSGGKEGTRGLEDVMNDCKTCLSASCNDNP